MAYIKSEEVKEMRTAIKKLFPAKDGWKFSITKEHYSTINVNIMAAPFDMDPENKGHYEIRDYYLDEYAQEIKDVFSKIEHEIVSRKAYYDRNAGDMGADYGDHTFFYYVYVGKWDKPFIKPVMKEIEVVEKKETTIDADDNKIKVEIFNDTVSGDNNTMCFEKAYNLLHGQTAFNYQVNYSANETTQYRYNIEASCSDNDEGSKRDALEMALSIILKSTLSNRGGEMENTKLTAKNYMEIHKEFNKLVCKSNQWALNISEIAEMPEEIKAAQKRIGEINVLFSTLNTITVKYCTLYYSIKTVEAVKIGESYFHNGQKMTKTNGYLDIELV